MFCSNWVVPVGRMGVSSPSARVWAPLLCPVLGTIILNLAWARWKRKKSAKLMACPWYHYVSPYDSDGDILILNSIFNFMGWEFLLHALLHHLVSHNLWPFDVIGANRRPYISCIAPLPRMPSVVPPDSKFQVVFQMAIPLAHQIRTHQIKLCLVLYSRNFLVVQHDFLSWISNESWDSLQARNPMRGFPKDITWPLPMHLRLPAEGVVPPSGAVQHGESHHACNFSSGLVMLPKEKRGFSKPATMQPCDQFQISSSSCQEKWAIFFKNILPHAHSIWNIMAVLWC